MALGLTGDQCEEIEGLDIVDQCRAIHREFYDLELCAREHEGGHGSVIEHEVSEQCRGGDRRCWTSLTPRGSPLVSAASSSLTARSRASIAS